MQQHVWKAKQLVLMTFRIESKQDWILCTMCNVHFTLLQCMIENQCVSGIDHLRKVSGGNSMRWDDLLKSQLKIWPVFMRRKKIPWHIASITSNSMCHVYIHWKVVIILSKNCFIESHWTHSLNGNLKSGMRTKCKFNVECVWKYREKQHVIQFIRNIGRDFIVNSISSFQLQLVIGS